MTEPFNPADWHRIDWMTAQRGQAFTTCSQCGRYIDVTAVGFTGGMRCADVGHPCQTPAAPSVLVAESYWTCPNCCTAYNELPLWANCVDHHPERTTPHA